jgi:hypothetical protein
MFASWLALIIMKTESQMLGKSASYYLTHITSLRQNWSGTRIHPAARLN